MGAISESNGTITFDVTVTNTGDVAGKDVVQVYYNPPYTNGGIENYRQPHCPSTRPTCWSPALPRP